MPRILDCILTIVLIIILLPLIFFIWIGTIIDTKGYGIFTQLRVGKNAELFKIYKFQSFKNGEVSKFGSFIRKYKLDELPQLLNILNGDMAIVGPRPDISGYYDKLIGNDRLLLDLRPGLTSPAAIKYRNEEEILSKVDKPLKYNDEVIFNDKVKMNLQYLHDKNIKNDLYIILNTIIIIFQDKNKDIERSN